MKMEYKCFYIKKSEEEDCYEIFSYVGDILYGQVGYHPQVQDVVFVPNKEVTIGLTNKLLKDIRKLIRNIKHKNTYVLDVRVTDITNAVHADGACGLCDKLLNCTSEKKICEEWNFNNKRFGIRV